MAASSGAGTRRIACLGWCDLAGRPDAMQIMVHRGHAYVAHLMSDGFSVVDISNPASPRVAQFVSAPPGTRSIHLQTHDDLLLVTNGANAAEMRRYDPGGAAGFFAGLRIYDIAQPGRPREIGRLQVDGLGIHRIWFVGGHYAYVSAHFRDCTDHIMAVVDIADPTSPELVGRWALPGMLRNSADVTSPPPGQRVGLHHAIIAGGLAYGAWRNGGLTIHDISTPSAPRLLCHRRFGPPFQGSTHTALPLPGRGLLIVADEPTAPNGEDGLPQCRIFDVREAACPVLLSTLPPPDDADYTAKGGKFGPHNLHENRPGSAIAMDRIFVTFHNAGLREYDISDPAHPKEIACFVPAFPAQLNGGVGIIQSCDIFAAESGLLYMTDTNAGLFILSRT